MKFANLKPSPTFAGSPSVEKDVRWIVRNALDNPDSLHVAADSLDTAASDLGRQGLHNHDGWELFCTMRGTFRFKPAGRPSAEFAKGSILIVPPDCFHSASTLPQPEDLRVLVIHIPDTSEGCGSFDVNGNHMGFNSALSSAQFAEWTELLGDTPGVIMGRIARFVAAAGWGREHALGLLRLLLSTYAEISTSAVNRGESPGRRVSEAILFLQNHYYEADLSLPKVAETIGISVSRLSGLFRKATGHSIGQTLIDIRLRRAMTLLRQSDYSIKEITNMTGWGNQLYFSAAFRKRYGRPPSAFRANV